jgi:hypothetical protein
MVLAALREHEKFLYSGAGQIGPLRATHRVSPTGDSSFIGFFPKTEDRKLETVFYHE